MSNLSVNTITNAAGGNTAQINGMTPTGLSLQGFRNRLFNGNMVIDQRNNGASVTPADTAYTIDRWRSRNDSKFSVQRSTVAPQGFINSLLVTSLSAFPVGSTDFLLQEQMIEGFNIADLGWGTANAQTVTLSFWVRSSLTGTFGGSLQNSASNRSYPFSYTISVANTFEYKTITIAGDTSGTWLTDNGVGIRLSISLGAGSAFSGTAGAWAGSNFRSATGAVSVVGTNGATFFITGVQLEAGAVATPFERRPFGTELALCQRYYEIVQGAGWSRGGDGLIMAGLPFKVTKRAAPTVTYSQISGNGSGSILNLFTPTIHTAGTYNSGAFLSGDGLFQGLASAEL